MAKITFKTETSQQKVLFPSYIGDLIPENHPVRLINKVVNDLTIDGLLKDYKGGGTSSFHPKTMLKILFYGYFNNIRSCRKIADALSENIYFMWIAGNCKPDFRTINHFRGKRLKNQINTIFSEITKMLVKAGYVTLKQQFIDGTKIESASNKYTFVWRKSTEKYKEKLEEKIKSILEEINEAIKEDDQAEDSSFLKIDSDYLTQKINEINGKLSNLNKSQQKKVKTLKEDHLPRMKKYETDLDILGSRNSFSKTDPDATFMRMKEDHMKNGQLKPAYNPQISTENQFITLYSITQQPTDTGTLIPHLNSFEETNGQQSEQVIADAGYGSEENYEYMETNDIEAYVKYNYFHKEQKRKFKNNIFHVENLFYNADLDFFICPMGQKMNKIGTSKRKSKLNYKSNISVYQAINCNGCPLRTQCHKAKTNRIINVSHKLRKYKRKAKEKLLSEEGIELRGRRCIEPEAVFGQIKFDNKFNRFTLRGLEKVNLEFGLVSIGHNLRKWAKKTA